MAKLCVDQLVQKLVTLFEEADEAQIDKIVTKAKSQLTAESGEARRNEIKKRLDSDRPKMGWGLRTGVI